MKRSNNKPKVSTNAPEKKNESFVIELKKQPNDEYVLAYAGCLNDK